MQSSKLTSRSQTFSAWQVRVLVTGCFGQVSLEVVYKKALMALLGDQKLFKSRYDCMIEALTKVAQLSVCCGVG